MIYLANLSLGADVADGLIMSAINLSVILPMPESERVFRFSLNCGYSKLCGCLSAHCRYLGGCNNGKKFKNVS